MSTGDTRQSSTGQARPAAVVAARPVDARWALPLVVGGIVLGFVSFNNESVSALVGFNETIGGLLGLALLVVGMRLGGRFTSSSRSARLARRIGWTFVGLHVGILMFWLVANLG